MDNIKAAAELVKLARNLTAEPEKPTYNMDESTLAEDLAEAVQRVETIIDDIRDTMRDEVYLFKETKESLKEIWQRRTNLEADLLSALEPSFEMDADAGNKLAEAAAKRFESDQIDVGMLEKAFHPKTFSHSPFVNIERDTGRKLPRTRNFADQADWSSLA